MCPVCCERVVDPDASTDPGLYSVMCDNCEKWYYLRCVGLSVSSEELKGDYVCDVCCVSANTAERVQ